MLTLWTNHNIPVSKILNCEEWALAKPQNDVLDAMVYQGNCPAFGKTYKKCGVTGHFFCCCKTKQPYQADNKVGEAKP